MQADNNPDQHLYAHTLNKSSRANQRQGRSKPGSGLTAMLVTRREITPDAGDTSSSQPPSDKEQRAGKIGQTDSEIV